ncbi:MAG: hypothetical protein AAF653_13250, partial [Chloroflexota bacterium]
LLHKFAIVEDIVARRIAATIGYWLLNKHAPAKPVASDMMSTFTNASKNDVTLSEFYTGQVRGAMLHLAPVLALEMPDEYEPDVEEELEFALLELEEKFDDMEAQRAAVEEPDNDEEEAEEVESEAEPRKRGPGFGFNLDSLFGGVNSSNGNDNLDDLDTVGENEEFAVFAQIVDEKPARTAAKPAARPAATATKTREQKDIIVTTQTDVTEAPQKEINLSQLSLNAEDAWHMIYNMMGYNSDYIQDKMLPRWQQQPDTFEQDRRFLYQVFIQAIRNASGVQYLAGNFTFADQNMTVDQLWNHYFTDLSQNVGPQLSVARLEAAVNDPWWKKAWQTLMRMVRNISPIWLLALVIALIFDGLTTYVSLDQTPMDGVMVWIFTVLITALFQIADMLVINYRKREFESDALIAKFKARMEQLTTTIASLDATSASYVQISMERSQAAADMKAAEDNRRMSRRGGFWSARIADINVWVTAYGFAFLFLDAADPVIAVYDQINTVMIQGQWQQFNLWVFLMVGLAVTVSFVINTAQRTEILGWSMRRMKNEA